MDLQAFLAAIDQQAEGILRDGAQALDVPPASLALFGGKRLRSRLVFECAHALGGDPSRVTTVAMAVELIHAASLCHDDVIDESGQRRGQPTLNARFGNGISVLFGDYLFSAAWLTACRGLGPQVPPILAEALVEMSSAEIVQSRLLWNAAPDYEACLRVARGKTAALFAACASATATALGASAAAIAAVREFGEGLGLAFQITDDLLDYLPESKAWGKRPLMDLRGGLPTLPLLFALRAGNGSARRSVLEFLATRGRTALEPSRVADLIRDSGADEQCRLLAQSYVDQGLAALHGHVSVNGLATLAHATVHRIC